MQRDRATDLARATGFGRRINRRQFLAGAAGAGAGLMAGGVMGIGSSLVRAAPFKGPDESAPWFERSIPELGELMASGQLSSRELTQAYLGRIGRLNPLLGAVIETSPDAIGDAAQRDAERRRGIVRGPLHGIPILLKDNIATADRMETTAGSLALVGTRVPADSPLVANLRAAGAVILGKTNLSEWANFRGFPPENFPFDTNYLNGWSARGGFTHDPYLLGFDPCGSSSGSGVAPAVNMCAAAVGTETDGSIVCPAGNNGIVGLKPTIGLIAQAGIIPISHSQDSAGPMTRTVRDTAIMLNVMRSPFGPVAGHSLPADYTAFLNPSFEGLRIGIERRQFLPEYFALEPINAVVEEAIGAMADAGAEIVDPVDTGDTFEWFDAEFLVLMHEFKGDIAAYLSGLRHTRRDTRMRTLADLIAFNQEHCEEEMKFFGQEIFELSEELSGDLNDPDYLAARNLCLQLTRTDGIDRVMAEHNLDAVLSPSYAFGSSAPACAGYPVMSVPVGVSPEGIPAGVWLYAGFLQEPELLRVGYAIEQLMSPREQPEFLGAVPADPPDAGLCDISTTAARAARAKKARRHGPMHPATGRAVGRPH
ncbi:MAG TPA: amidase family protein [Candidatus Limnocylindria bacterium]|nr:amidase family protein [Candidatus Limnocylindria bacterium]